MIRISGMTKSYGAEPVLQDVNAEFLPGRVSYVLGANGAGKTTLFKCVLGLERYTGEVRFSGEQAGEHALDDVRAEVFPAFDHSPLYLHLSGYDNLRLLLGCRQPREEVVAAAKGLIEHRLLASKARGYSYGQRKKIYALALVLRHPLFPLLDELSNGLDQESLKWLRNRITAMKSGRTIVMTGHHFDFYGPLVDDVFVLQQGRVTKVDYNHEKGDSLNEIYESTARCAV